MFLVVVVVFGCGFLNGFAPVSFKWAGFQIGGVVLIGGGCGSRCWLWFDGLCLCVCVCVVMDLEKRRKTKVTVRKKNSKERL